MKERVLSGWTVQRWLRLALAVIFLGAGIQGHETVAYAAAAFFGVQALFNVGCCGVAPCVPRVGANTVKDPPGVVYEEVH